MIHHLCGPFQHLLSAFAAGIVINFAFSVCFNESIKFPPFGKAFSRAQNIEAGKFSITNDNIIIFLLFWLSRWIFVFLFSLHSQFDYRLFDSSLFLFCFFFAFLFICGWRTIWKRRCREEKKKHKKRNCTPHTQVLFDHQMTWQPCFIFDKTHDDII